jgi:hypothetical protein
MEIFAQSLIMMHHYLHCTYCAQEAGEVQLNWSMIIGLLTSHIANLFFAYPLPPYNKHKLFKKNVKADTDKYLMFTCI